MLSDRISLIDEGNALQIKVKRKRPLATVWFMILWVFGWAFGEWAVITMLLVNSELPTPVFIFSLFWLAGWSWGGYKAIKGLARIFLGQQIASINQEGILLKETFTDFIESRFFEKSKIFDISLLNKGKSKDWALAMSYRSDSVFFAYDIPEEDAAFLLQKVKNLGYPVSEEKSEELNA